MPRRVARTGRDVTTHAERFRMALAEVGYGDAPLTAASGYLSVKVGVVPTDVLWRAANLVWQENTACLACTDAILEWTDRVAVCLAVGAGVRDCGADRGETGECPALTFGDET